MAIKTFILAPSYKIAEFAGREVLKMHRGEFVRCGLISHPHDVEKCYGYRGDWEVINIVSPRPYVLGDGAHARYREVVERVAIQARCYDGKWREVEIP